MIAGRRHLAGNIIGTYNVFEAARRTGVKRVVFASSGATVVGFARDEPYKAIREGRYEDVPDEFTKITHMMTRPQGIYGATKVWGEAIGRHFSDAHGLSVICVRIGQVWPENRPLSVVDYDRYTSHRDVATMFHSCIEAPDDSPVRHLPLHLKQHVGLPGSGASQGSPGLGPPGFGGHVQVGIG